MTRIVPVIMSGGSGTRLWPLSRTAHPKQLHALVSDRTMLQETVRRVSGADEHYRFEPPIVVLNERQCDLARSQLEAMDAGAVRLVVEPVGRNTAPVAAVAAELVRREHGEDTLILLLPADHHIRDAAGFRAAVATGAGLAENGHIITFGIQPERPETGYGYIRRGEPLDGGYRVRAFTEKPDLERARGFLLVQTCPGERLGHLRRFADLHLHILHECRIRHRDRFAARWVVDVVRCSARARKAARRAGFWVL